MQTKTPARFSVHSKTHDFTAVVHPLMLFLPPKGGPPVDLYNTLFAVVVLLSIFLPEWSLSALLAMPPTPKIVDRAHGPM